MWFVRRTWPVARSTAWLKSLVGGGATESRGWSPAHTRPSMTKTSSGAWKPPPASRSQRTWPVSAEMAINFPSNLHRTMPSATTSTYVPNDSFLRGRLPLWPVRQRGWPEARSRHTTASSTWR